MNLLSLLHLQSDKGSVRYRIRFLGITTSDPQKIGEVNPFRAERLSADEIAHLALYGRHAFLYFDFDTALGQRPSHVVDIVLDVA